ncbi:MAG: hypothetical protein RIT45_1993 [Pseudomonadota bacterium]
MDSILRRDRGWLALVLVVALTSMVATTLPRGAVARSAIEARAAKMSDEAAAHFKAGRYLEAAERFEQAYALDPEVLVRLRNAGRAWEEAGRPDRARHCFERYLEKEQDPALRKDAEERIAKARAAIEARSQAENSAPSATPAASGKGEHATTAGAAGDVTVHAASGRDWQLPLAVAVGGVALAATGAGWFVAAQDKADVVEQADKAGQYAYPGGASKREDDLATIDRNRIGAVALVGVGVAGLGVATWLWLRDGTETQEAGVRLLPRWTGRDAGLVLDARF